MPRPRAATAYAVVTGGGTGGHVYPALAVADELIRHGHPPDEIRFVGARRGIEAVAVPAAGFEVEVLPGRGFRRRATLAAARDNLLAVADAARAVVAARRILRRTRPRVVFGVGGYASLPCIVAARLARVPTVVHEQNAAPGLANRLAVRLGATPAVSLPGTPLPGAVLTGNPVRRSITDVDRHADRDHPVVLVFGGSLGAGRLNDAALGLFDHWRDRPDLTGVHVTGRRDYAACATRLAALRRPDDQLHFELVEYEDHMERQYARATVALTRAGAVTVAELAVVGLPAVLVPLPGAPGDHQTRNADALADAGAAVRVPDADATPARLADELDRLLGDPARLDAMSHAARTLGRPDAAARVAALVEATARA
ncbi:MAG TPA: undecaprenyldiphospho-muramoylpentapeptide beta-N-acetylglucosaminyltransferase [Acidimicrobiia bacterium]|nr:undecaprenyldiphospho-muramoylpentapeptide beta-N-acetylglucosaminyltransferase [Acidimicrobiia bacterium]